MSPSQAAPAQAAANRPAVSPCTQAFEIRHGKRTSLTSGYLLMEICRDGKRMGEKLAQLEVDLRLYASLVKFAQTDKEVVAITEEDVNSCVCGVALATTTDETSLVQEFFKRAVEVGALPMLRYMVERKKFIFLALGSGQKSSTKSSTG